jgi:HSP20 family protein
MALMYPESRLAAGLWQEVNRIFQELLPFDPAAQRTLAATDIPPVDIWETETEVVVGVELPGVNPDHIRVAWSQGRLTVEGDKREEAESGPRTYLCMERSFGSFQRVVLVPRAADLTRATAVYRRGILTVRLPKVSEKRGGRTDIVVRHESGPEGTP